MTDVTAEMGHGYEDVQGDIHTVVESHLESEENATEVVWFPFDLPNSLVKEIIWESGGNLVTSVLYGTPAAGNGVQACLEMGCSVLSLCENEHHMEHLTKTLQNKFVQCASKKQPYIRVGPPCASCSPMCAGGLGTGQEVSQIYQGKERTGTVTYNWTYPLKKRRLSHKQASSAYAAGNTQLRTWGLIQRKPNNKHVLSDFVSVDS